MWISWLGLIAGFAILVVAADRFVDGTAAIARNLGISPLIIGLTIVGFGTSAPEILVSGMAAWQGNPGIAIGNAIGSNIANIGLILGLTAILCPISFHSRIVRKEMPILLGTSIGCYLLALSDGLSRTDGIVMLGGLAIFLLWLIRGAIQTRQNNAQEAAIEEDITANISTAKACWWTAAGLIGLLVSSQMVVWSAAGLARAFGISDLVIGLTIIALGTSLPELAASITSVLKKEDDIAIGNVLGSNMYNLLAVLALPSLISPGPLEPVVLSRDFPGMIGFTVALFAFGFSFRAHGRINRFEGLVLILGYFGYQFLVIRGTL
jgi:cation:H+ antiporter